MISLFSNNKEARHRRASLLNRFKLYTFDKGIEGIEDMLCVVTGSSTNLQIKRLSARGLHSVGNVHSVTPR